MSKRFIRLKELKPNLNKGYIPPGDYLEKASLKPNEVYLVRTDSEGNPYSVWSIKSKRRVYISGTFSIESLYTRGSM